MTATILQFPARDQHVTFPSHYGPHRSPDLHTPRCPLGCGWVAAFQTHYPEQAIGGHLGGGCRDRMLRAEMERKGVPVPGPLLNHHTHTEGTT